MECRQTQTDRPSIADSISTAYASVQPLRIQLLIWRAAPTRIAWDIQSEKQNSLTDGNQTESFLGWRIDPPIRGHLIMEVDYAIGVAVLLMTTLFIAFFIFSFGTKKKSQSEETKRAAVRKRNFTPPSRTADEATIESVAARLGLVRDNSCVITLSIDLKVYHKCCISY